MAFEDKTLTCVECAAAFVFSARDQEFFATKGFTNEPKRCPDCRAASRNRRSYGGGSSSGSSSYGGGSGSGSYGSRAPREMYPAVCASCGKETQVPFQPRQGRPVYCSDCYSKTRSTSTTGRR